MQPRHDRAGSLARRACLLLPAALGLLLLATLPLPALADPFAELPLRHWSFDALAELVPSGLVNGPTVAAYRVRQGVMRFEAALLVAQAVRALEALRPGEVVDLDRLVGARTGTSDNPHRLTAGEVAALRRLVGEFAAELEVLEVQVSGAAPSPGPLALPAPAQGPFVDLDTLTRLAEAGEPLEIPAPVAAQAGGTVEPVAPGASLSAAASAAASAAGPAADAAPAAGPVFPAAIGAEAPLVTVASAMAAAGPIPGVISSEDGDLERVLERALTGGGGIVPAGLPEVALPQGALTRPGEAGPFSGQVAAERQLTYGSMVAVKPVLALDAALQTGEARLPWPARNVSVSPTVRVSSSVAQPGPEREGAGAVEVEAAVNLSGVEVGASVKKVQGLTPPVDDKLASALRVGLTPASQGYGVNVRLGQVAVSTGVDQVRKDEESLETRRSLEVGYALGSKAVVRAGYHLVDLDAVGGSQPVTEGASGSRSRTDASLGVDVNLSRIATVSAGLTVEGMQGLTPGGAVEGQRATAGVELRLPWNAFVTAGYEFYNPANQTPERRSQSAATVGVGYNFASNATLLVGYRLIDFDAGEPSEVASPQQNLMAGVSLNF